MTKPFTTGSGKQRPGGAKHHPRISILSQEQVYDGPVFGVTTYFVREPGGIKARRDVVTHSGSVVVIALDERGTAPKVLLVRQYRLPARQWLWELPAGRKEPGESALGGAKRELKEETGVTARRWKHAFRFWASPGFLAETMDIFLARDLAMGEATPEEDENIEVRWLQLRRAQRMAMRGEIEDAKTMAGVLWLAGHLDAAPGGAKKARRPGVPSDC